MKSKTLKLINRYHRILEQDMQNANPEMEEPTEALQEPEIIPLSSTSEIRYIQDVVLALLYGQVSENDKTKLEQIQVALKDPQKAQDLLQNTGDTIKDFYIKEILPIIKPIRDDQDTLNNLNAIG
jgi:hypothetical protein